MVGAEWKGVSMLSKLISLEGLRTGAYPQGLRPKGAESTLDRPSTHINHSHTGKADPSIGEVGFLGMIPGGVQDHGCLCLPWLPCRP